MRHRFELALTAVGIALALSYAAHADSPWDDAAAHWSMVGAPKDAELTVRGAVQLGVALADEELAASRVRGGEGRVAQFDDGWLVAEPNQDIPESQRALTVALRFMLPAEPWEGPIFGRFGAATGDVFSIATEKREGRPLLWARLGSDEVCGYHEVAVDLDTIGRSAWHDLVLRFDGRKLQLYVDGALRDEENAVSTVRRGEQLPYFFGAEPIATLGPTGTNAAAEARATTHRQGEPDIVFDDFEQGNYAKWTVEGDAFQKRPSKAGEIFHHETMKGWQGDFLADSFLESSDTATGKLVSVPFTINRRYLSFLIAGGIYPGKTGINLLVDGQVVRTASGDGSETLVSKRWDVGQFEGKTAQLEIVDDYSLGWGHVMVDQIVLTDAAVGPGRFRGQLDYAAVWNRTLSDEEIATLSAVKTLGDQRPVYYHEKYRPQFHFTAQKHWINDPNGLVFYQGVYHMCFQHQPPGRPWALKDWGHAVSTDLVHWTELDSAVTPHREWGGCWSGSAVVDWNNTSGFQTGSDPPIVAALTNGGLPGVGVACTQCLAVSVDGYKTFRYYEKNPVIGHIIECNRDPKVIWYEPTKRWILSIYLAGNDYGMFASPDLKQWERIGTVTLPGVTECPDFFPLAVDGNPANTKWVFWGAANGYFVGSFDGQTFQPEGELGHADFGGNYYAAQTWSDIPASDGRRIQIGWMAGGQYPDMPFTQQLSFPTEVTLRTTPEGIRMYRVPVREIQGIRKPGKTWNQVTIQPGENPWAGLSGELFDLTAEYEVGQGGTFGLTVRGEPIEYRTDAETITVLGRSAHLTPENGRVKLRVLVDRTSMEVFANDGRVVLSSCFLPKAEDQSLGVFTTAGTRKLVSAEVHPLGSIWPK